MMLKGNIRAVGAATLALLVGGAHLATSARAAEEVTPDIARAMVNVLVAPGPHARIRKEARTFDRFVGTWDLDCTLTASDHTVTRFRGKWIFGWILDGHAMQDVLLRETDGGNQRLGTTVRFVDHESNQWRIVWIPPRSGQVITLSGGPVGDRIVLEGSDPAGARLRWSFSDMRPDSFHWRGEISADRGRTWRTEQEMWLKRDRSGGSARD